MKLKIKTFKAKHLNQLGWNHDENLPLDKYSIIGKHQGGILMRHKKTKDLIRYSVGAFVMQRAYTMNKEGIPWPNCLPRAKEEEGNIEQLFTD